MLDADARSKLAAALAPVEDGDPAILVDLVDSLEPPALMLGWGAPWLQPDTACFDNGLLYHCWPPALDSAPAPPRWRSRLTPRRRLLAAGGWPRLTKEPRHERAELPRLARNRRRPLQEASAMPEPTPTAYDPELTNDYG